jgi:hypothetical protein
MADDESILARIQAFDAANGGGVAVKRDRGAYVLTFLGVGAPIARLKPTGDGDEVRLAHWSHRGKWEDVGGMGGVFLPLDEALDYIASEGLFWTWT